VQDNGIGIPEGVKPRTFEKFFRAENAVITTVEGTGLGLYIAKTIAEASGSKLWFQSKEGIGSTFFVAFPVKGMKKREGDKRIER
jgi:signal transduction histidine kinase